VKSARRVRPGDEHGVMTIDASRDNYVFLRGRLAAEPTLRELPSGDELAIFRLTVARPPNDRGRVDSIECASTGARVRKALLRAVPGAELEVTGSLHRRFWRTPTGPASRYAVDVELVKVLAKPGRRGAASPGRTPASA
jgi:single-strand DNA-binding protein